MEEGSERERNKKRIGERTILYYTQSPTEVSSLLLVFFSVSFILLICFL